MHLSRVLSTLSVGVLAMAALAPMPAQAAPASAAAAPQAAQISSEVHHDTSPPLSSIRPDSSRGNSHPALRHGQPNGQPGHSDSDTSGTRSNLHMPSPSTSGNGIVANGSAPPDSAGAAGTTQYVELVNTQFAVYNKAGGLLLGPQNTNTLWAGFGGGCQTNNDGDGTILWDTMAQRWFIQQFSVTGASSAGTPYLECVAISTTADATGSWNRYSFQEPNFPDYPKTGVWPDAYYASFNLFNDAGTAYLGARVCAFARVSMLAGQAATQQCFDAGTTYASLLPATLDGTTQPPVGAPDWFVALGANITDNTLASWQFHVDWTTPANSTLTAPAIVTVGQYTEACNGGTCVPQYGTRQRLDSLADRLMFRLAYRNFGDHQAMVVNHAILAGSSVGERWYELRPSGGSLSVFQQGTYAPDSNYRWMGSIAMDSSGNMGLGYSVSSSSVRPGIRYTGRLVTDAAGQMPQGETTVITGAGSQTGGLSRWGDYSEMTVDPADDCTFWYVNEYIPSNGSFNWHTRIASFKFPGCTSAPPDFSMSANPSNLSINQGASGTSTISTTVTSGSAQTISLSASGLPAGASASFNPTSVNSGGSSTMTIASATTAAGTYPLTVTGTGASATHTTSLTLTVTAPPANDFSISASPSSLSLNQGSSGTSTIGTALTSGAAQSIALSASGMPAGGSSSLSPTSVNSGGSSTMTIGTTTTTPAGTYTVTVTGTGTSATHSSSVSLTVVANDFSISANPSSVSLNAGSSGTSTSGTALTSGAAQSIALSASGLPTNATAGFNPSSVTSGGSSTMTISTAGSTPTGTYTITVTGIGTSAMHTTSLSLTVTAPPGSQPVVNGGFETGTFSGWTTSGQATAVVVGGHSGSFAARLGTTSPTNGDSTTQQMVTVPAAGGTLTFWYQPHCPDSLTYDQEQMQVRNTSGATLLTLLNVCSNSGAWSQVSADLGAYASQNVVLWFNSHDDNYATDPTYTLFDDVAINPTPPPSPNILTNGGFETGNFSGWTISGQATAIVSGGHSGSFAARLGSTSPTNGDSVMRQTVTVPAAGGTLSFWYQPHCPDTLTYDQEQMQIRNTSGATLLTVLNVCSNSGAWTQVIQDLSAYRGQAIVLGFNNHDDNYAGDPTYTLFDDISVR